MIKYAPIYIKDETKFILPYPDYMGDTAEDAAKIALGTMLVECLAGDFKYTDEILKINTKVGLEHIRARLDKVDILIIGGKLFDSSEEE